MISLVELVAVCAEMQSRNLALFEQLGQLATSGDVPAGPEQQRLAVACHRHAWHAELWTARQPTVAGLTATVGSVAAFDRYDDALAALRAEVDAIAARVDPLLDPSTARVTALVTADLAALASTGI